LKFYLALKGLTKINKFFALITPNFLDKKLAALKIYGEEIKKSPNSRSLESAKNPDPVKGLSIGTYYAEAFFVERIHE